MVTISNELLLAILSMDAYNRNYSPSITDQGLPNVGMSGSQIGTATLLEIPRPSNYQSASFFAQAYTLANGQTVISYRGTDQPLRDRDDRYASSAASEMATVKRPDNGVPRLDRPTVD